MKRKWGQFAAGRTHELLSLLPKWIVKDSDSKLFQLFNIIGRESQIARDNTSKLKDEFHPFHTFLNTPTNLKKVEGIPKGEYQFIGKRGNEEFPLVQVYSEQDLLDNEPTRLSFVGDSIVGTNVKLINILFVTDVSDGEEGWIAITDHHPLNLDFIRKYRIDGTFVSQSDIGRRVQSYEETGTDEEIVFDENKTAKLKHLPIDGTVKVYDFLNLDANGNATDVTASITINGRTITWSDTTKDPDGRYVAEYEYGLYHGIRAIDGQIKQWNVASNKNESDPQVYVLKQDELIYNPDTSSGIDLSQTYTIKSNSRIVNPPIIEITKELDTAGNVVYYALRVQAHQLRAGRTVTVYMIGTEMYSDTWTDPTTDYVFNMKNYDIDFIDTHPQSVQVFDANDNEISHHFIREVSADGVVRIRANSAFAGTTPKINIYYRKEFYNIALSTETDTVSYTYAGNEYLYTKIDVTSLVQLSLTIPEVSDFTIEAEEDYVAIVHYPHTVSFYDESFQPVAYLERRNQAIHFKEAYGNREFIHLLGTKWNETYNAYESPIMLYEERNETDNAVIASYTFDVRDMVLVDDRLFILKTVINDSDPNYIKASPDRISVSAIDVIHAFSMDHLKTYYLPLKNAVSITYGLHDRLHILWHTQSSGTDMNVIRTYQMEYDYIFLHDAGDTYTAYIRPEIDTLITEDGV